MPIGLDGDTLTNTSTGPEQTKTQDLFGSLIEHNFHNPKGLSNSLSRCGKFIEQNEIIFPKLNQDLMVPGQKFVAVLNTHDKTEVQTEIKLGVLMLAYSKIIS
ncbi:hypothetical protein ACMFMF_000079 [Clarireedia jacksonii]